MKSVDPYTKGHMALTIKVNGLALRPTSIPDSILRFVRPLAFYNEDQTHELSFSGTSLRFRMGNRNFLLCSRHQLTNHGRRPEDIVIVLDVGNGQRVAINPNEVGQAVLGPEADVDDAYLADMLIAEYAPRSTERDLSPHFLQMDLLNVPDLRAMVASSIDAIFTLGFPTSDTDYSTFYDDDFNVTGVDIVSRWWKLYFRQDDANVWDKRGLVPLEPARSEDPLPIDPDGLSGAPVFFIHGMKKRKPGLGFAGIVLRANKRGRVNILEAEAIRRAIRMFLSEA